MMSFLIMHCKLYGYRFTCLETRVVAYLFDGTLVACIPGQSLAMHCIVADRCKPDGGAVDCIVGTMSNKEKCSMLAFTSKIKHAYQEGGQHVGLHLTGHGLWYGVGKQPGTSDSMHLATSVYGISRTFRQTCSAVSMFVVVLHNM
jgi:hypothetical protein